MKNLLKNKALVIGGVILAAVVIFFVVAGSFKFDASEKGRDKEGTAVGTPKQETKLASRGINFGGTGGKPEFSIKPPVGWARGEKEGVDLAIGSITPDKLPDGRDFTTNIIATVSPHPITASSIENYNASWKKYLLNLYPSMEFIKDSTATVGGVEAYVVEGKQTRADGLVVHQLQYVFYINDKYAMGITASSPDAFWNNYKDAMKISIESLTEEGR